MAAHLDAEQLQQAFGSRPDILAGIQSAADSPARIALFNSISQFVCEQGNAGDEPASKRRRVDGANGGTNDASHGVNRATLPARQAVPGSAVASSGANGDVMSAAAAEPVLLEIKDISLSVPQRKKFDLCFTRNYLYARVPGTTAPVSGIVYEWKTIEHVFYVPVPDKAQIQHNYVLFPHHAALASLPSAAAAAALPSAPAEPLLFTVPATAPKPGSVGGPSAGLAASVSDTYSSLLHWALEAQLRSAGNRLVPAGLGNAVVAADARVFHSTTRPAFRPAEKAVHVRAFRGSKDGFLFFLPTGIFWGFKKPLLFLALDRIVAVSYTNVLQRTFNMVVEVDVGGGGQTEEIEFAMIDQEDYGVIDENYVRRHGLQDRSMAEQRKAKRELAENARGEGKKKGGDGDGEGAEEGDDGDDKEMTGTGDDEDDGLTELQRAEKQLQDEEDEMEEDYDPGSDSDSEGSGSSEDEEDSEEGEGGEEDGDDDDGGEPEDREEEEEEEAEHFDVVGKDE